MGVKTPQSRKYVLAGAGALFLAAGAYGLLQVYPALGPSAGTIGPAQKYIDDLADGTIPQRGRYVLVDAASARLYMIENGRVRDTMKVIVGKPEAETPALRSVIYYATLNPYWNVPPDLAEKIVAPRVLQFGDTYLKEKGYEIVTGFGDGAKVLPASGVHWKDVAAGTEKVYIRQRPGPANSMGHLKFGLADSTTIYLHDTPNKDPFAKDARNLSNGCVRLEDAPRFARWLLGRDPEVTSTTPEQHVPIPGAMPITIAYLGARAQTQLAGLQ